MAKANRKRANKNIEKKEIKPVEIKKERTIYDDFPVVTLNQDDANRMKEIFTLSNNVSALIRDYAEKQIAVKNMRVMAEKIRKERQPLFIQIAKNMLKTERGYDAVADDILKQAEQIEMSLILIHGQIEHRYEDYVSTLIRHNRFVEGVIRSAENKMITGHRSDRETRAEEEKIFDKGFEEELKKEAVTIEKESKPKE